MKEIILLGLGALLGAVSYWYKSNVERRALFRRAVFLFLELWSLVKALDKRRIENGIRLLGERIQNRFGPIAIPADQKPLLDSLIQGFLDNLIAMRLAQCSKIVSPSFSEIVNGIASYDPLLAFRLNGSEEIGSLIGSVNEYLDRLQKIDPHTRVPQEFVSAVSGHISDALEKELALHLHALAWGAGPVVWLRVVLKMRDLKADKTSDLTAEIDAYLDTVEKTLKAQTSADIP